MLVRLQNSMKMFSNYNIDSTFIIKYEEIFFSRVLSSIGRSEVYEAPKNRIKGDFYYVQGFGFVCVTTSFWPV